MTSSCNGRGAVRHYLSLRIVPKRTIRTADPDPPSSSAAFSVPVPVCVWAVQSSEVQYDTFIRAKHRTEGFIQCISFYASRLPYVAHSQSLITFFFLCFPHLEYLHILAPAQSCSAGPPKSFCSGSRSFFVDFAACSIHRDGRHSFLLPSSFLDNEYGERNRTRAGQVGERCE